VEKGRAEEEDEESRRRIEEIDATRESERRWTNAVGLRFL
jgi:hypothetical protein